MNISTGTVADSIIDYIDNNNNNNNNNDNNKPGDDAEVESSFGSFDEGKLGAKWLPTLISDQADQLWLRVHQ